MMSLGLQTLLSEMLEFIKGAALLLNESSLMSVG